MTFKLDALFESPDKRYLDANDLSILSQYVSSIPERVRVYRTVRDQEVTIMQAVADTLQQQTNQPEDLVERSIRNGLMVLRYVAMAMLLDDQGFIEERLRGWLPEIVKAYETQAIDPTAVSAVGTEAGSGANPASTAFNEAHAGSGPGHYARHPRDRGLPQGWSPLTALGPTFWVQHSGSNILGGQARSPSCHGPDQPLFTVLRESNSWFLSLIYSLMAGYPATTLPTTSTSKALPNWGF